MLERHSLISDPYFNNLPLPAIMTPGFLGPDVPGGLNMGLFPEISARLQDMVSCGAAAAAFYAREVLGTKIASEHGRTMKMNL